MNPEMAKAIRNMIPLIVIAGVLAASIKVAMKESERMFIERVCIGGPL